MKLYHLTYLAFETNAVLDARPNFALTFAEVHKAARERQLISLLRQRFGELAELSAWVYDTKGLADTEVALRDAASIFELLERPKAGVRNRGICLVMAIPPLSHSRQFAACRTEASGEGGSIRGWFSGSPRPIVLYCALSRSASPSPSCFIALYCALLW